MAGTVITAPGPLGTSKGPGGGGGEGASSKAFLPPGASDSSVLEGSRGYPGWLVQIIIIIILKAIKYQ